MYKLFSALIGILITVMIAFNGALSRSAGNYSALVIIHLSGLALISFILIFKRIKIKRHKNIPIYFYSAGAIGIFTVLFNNISFNSLGASLTLSLGLLGQSIASIIIDHYGFLEMNITKFKKEKLIGIFIIFLGILIMTLY